MPRTSVTSYTYSCDYPECPETITVDTRLQANPIEGELADGMWVISNLGFDERYYCTDHGRVALIFIPADLKLRRESYPFPLGLT